MLFMEIARPSRTGDSSDEDYKDDLLDIIEKGAEINATDEDGMTPLHIAVQAGNELAVQVLLDLHANVNILNNDYQTPLEIALAGDNQVIRELFESLQLEQIVSSEGFL